MKLAPHAQISPAPAAVAVVVVAATTSAADEITSFRPSRSDRLANLTQTDDRSKGRWPVGGTLLAWRGILPRQCRIEEGKRGHGGSEERRGGEECRSRWSPH